MPQAPNSLRPGRMWAPVIASVIACGLLAAVIGTAPGQSFLSSLRIARPAAVSAGVPGPTNNNGALRLQNMIGGMLAKTVNVVVDEADRSAAGATAASKEAGFAVRLPRTRTDAPALTVIGAHAIDMTVDIGQLRTVFVEAGKSNVPLPESAQGSRIVLRTARAIRAQYGNCPAPPPATLQGQVQGPPPPSTDNASCIVLVEAPAVSADVPQGLDMAPLMEIALELSGMSPVEAQAVPHTLDWRSTLALSLPRNLRSVETKEVNGTPAMLLITAGRRGPTWELVWAKDGMSYALTGYGNSGDALPLANSIN